MDNEELGAWRVLSGGQKCSNLKKDCQHFSRLRDEHDRYCECCWHNTSVRKEYPKEIYGPYFDCYGKEYGHDR